MLFTLAFRNIWRNKRRTLITLAAIVFAVFISTVMRSFQKGAWDNVFDSSVNLFFGYIQVHGNGFWDDQNIDNSFAYDKELIDLSTTLEDVDGYAPRLESFALASSDNLTQGVAVIGVDPKLENDLTGVRDKIINGTYFSDNLQGVILAEGVANKLKLEVGDTLVLISQGYHGANAAGKYNIDGIFKYALPDLNKTLVYLPLPLAQSLYDANGRLTSIALNISHESKVSPVLAQLTEQLDLEKFEVMDYKDLMPELIQARQLDEGGGYVTLGILYALIGFAIFGTIIMMTEERRYEYGVLTAIGMSRWQLFIITFLETVSIGILGAILGIIVAIPVVYFLHINPLDLSIMGEEATAAFENFGMEPIIPAAFSARVFFTQALVIFIITSLLGLYPMYKIFNLKPVAAMRP